MESVYLRLKILKNFNRMRGETAVNSLRLKLRTRKRLFQEWSNDLLDLQVLNKAHKKRHPLPHECFIRLHRQGVLENPPLYKLCLLIDRRATKFRDFKEAVKSVMKKLTDNPFFHTSK